MVVPMEDVSDEWMLQDFDGLLDTSVNFDHSELMDAVDMDCSLSKHLEAFVEEAIGSIDAEELMKLPDPDLPIPFRTNNSLEQSINSINNSSFAPPNDLISSILPITQDDTISKRSTLLISPYSSNDSFESMQTIIVSKSTNLASEHTKSVSFKKHETTFRSVPKALRCMQLKVKVCASNYERATMDELFADKKHDVWDEEDCVLDNKEHEFNEQQKITDNEEKNILDENRIFISCDDKCKNYDQEKKLHDGKIHINICHDKKNNCDDNYKMNDNDAKIYKSIKENSRVKVGDSAKNNNHNDEKKKKMHNERMKTRERKIHNDVCYQKKIDCVDKYNKPDEKKKANDEKMYKNKNQNCNENKSDCYDNKYKNHNDNKKEHEEKMHNNTKKSDNKYNNCDKSKNKLHKDKNQNNHNNKTDCDANYNNHTKLEVINKDKMHNNKKKKFDNEYKKCVKTNYEKTDCDDKHKNHNQWKEMHEKTIRNSKTKQSDRKYKTSVKSKTMHDEKIYSDNSQQTKHECHDKNQKSDVKKKMINEKMFENNETDCDDKNKTNNKHEITATQQHSPKKQHCDASYKNCASSKKKAHDDNNKQSISSIFIKQSSSEMWTIHKYTTPSPITTPKGDKPPTPGRSLERFFQFSQKRGQLFSFDDMLLDDKVIAMPALESPIISFKAPNAKIDASRKLSKKVNIGISVDNRKCRNKNKRKNVESISFGVSKKINKL